jgi:murein DD-endopeptidase MepM/ murein hydrolase activator NlpD
MTARARARLLIVLVPIMMTTLAVPSARAETAVDRALADRSSVAAELRAFREGSTQRVDSLRAWIAHSTLLLRRDPGFGLLVTSEHWHGLVREARGALLTRLDAYAAWRSRRIARLEAERDDITRWLETVGVFRVCPVPSATEIHDNFGYTVRLPGVPVHVHQGNDIMAAMDAPILAPFDGEAWSTSSDLGGLSVYVRGAHGTVYNAHLSQLGTVGRVRAGEVIGYVGVSGDAVGPHDHLSWYPGDDDAADPYPLLAAACLEDRP